MDEKEYLQTLGEQIVNPHARASVLAEIQDHIEEQAQDYRASGMSEAVAMHEAVRQMGDPVSTGEALNQVHRPKFPIALFGLAVVLTVLGIAMQYLVYTHLTPDTAILSDTYLQRTILYNAIGLGLLLLCIFGNYMYLAKGAWILLAIFLLGLLPPWFFGFYGRQYTLCYYLALVYPLVYALLLYRLRDKGAKAIWFLHGLTLLFLVRMLFGTIITWSTVLAAGCLTLLLLCLAIHRGILTGSSKRTLCLLTVLPYVAAAACFVILFFQNSYMRPPDGISEGFKLRPANACAGAAADACLWWRHNQFLCGYGKPCLHLCPAQHLPVVWYRIRYSCDRCACSPCTAQSSLCPAPEQPSGSAGRHCCKWDSSF